MDVKIETHKNHQKPIWDHGFTAAAVPLAQNPHIFIIHYLALLSINQVKMEWVGTYNDPIYGGEIYVCVSQVEGNYIGQGVFSRIGYMRGKIENNLWSGNFWSAGLEVKQGSFKLQLETTGNTTFSGSFLEDPEINYLISSNQTSSATPEDMECFKTDDDLLKADAPFYSLNGIWQAYATQYNLFNEVRCCCFCSIGCIHVKTCECALHSLLCIRIMYYSDNDASNWLHHSTLMISNVLFIKFLLPFPQNTNQLTCSYEVLGEGGYVGAAYHNSYALNGQVTSGE